MQFFFNAEYKYIFFFLSENTYKFKKKNTEFI